MNTEDKYTKKDMIDFGKLCSENPQMNVDHLYNQWIVPQSVILPQPNITYVKPAHCICTTSVGVSWINNVCFCTGCDKAMFEVTK